MLVRWRPERVVAAPAMWASHVVQGRGTPRPLESVGVTAHTYYEGTLPAHACMSIQSILATQPRSTKVTVWSAEFKIVSKFFDLAFYCSAVCSLHLGLLPCLLGRFLLYAPFHLFAPLACDSL